MSAPFPLSPWRLPDNVLADVARGSGARVQAWPRVPLAGFLTTSWRASFPPSPRPPVPLAASWRRPGGVLAGVARAGGARVQAGRRRRPGGVLAGGRASPPRVLGSSDGVPCG